MQSLRATDPDGERFKAARTDTALRSVDSLCRATERTKLLNQQKRVYYLLIIREVIPAYRAALPDGVARKMRSIPVARAIRAQLCRKEKRFLNRSDRSNSSSGC